MVNGGWYQPEPTQALFNLKASSFGAFWTLIPLLNSSNCVGVMVIRKVVRLGLNDTRIPINYDGFLFRRKFINNIILIEYYCNTLKKRNNTQDCSYIFVTVTLASSLLICFR